MQFCILVIHFGQQTLDLVCSSFNINNSSYWFVWYLLARTPSLAATWRAPAVVWNAAAVSVLSAEVTLIAFIVVVAFFLQSRKRDFI